MCAEQTPKHEQNHDPGDREEKTEAPELRGFTAFGWVQYPALGQVRDQVGKSRVLVMVRFQYDPFAVLELELEDVDLTRVVRIPEQRPIPPRHSTGIQFETAKQWHSARENPERALAGRTTDRSKSCGA